MHAAITTADVSTPMTIENRTIALPLLRSFSFMERENGRRKQLRQVYNDESTFQVFELTSRGFAPGAGFEVLEANLGSPKAKPGLFGPGFCILMLGS
ncbi:hypothetical protein SD208_10960 [Ochrobactrum sp. BD67]